MADIRVILGPIISTEPTSKPLSKCQRSGDNIEGTELIPSSKCIKARQVVDCVLIQTCPGTAQVTQVAPHSRQLAHAPAPANNVDLAADTHSFAFVLTDQECHDLKKPATMSVVINTDLYMRFTFNIDMTNVPGSIRQSSNMTGKCVIFLLYSWVELRLS